MWMGAIISPCGLYRYSLTRRWADGDTVAWIMLNPSTADASMDDPTIRRCISFSKNWGYGGLQVVNLYGYRATKPDALKAVVDPIGPDHEVHFMGALQASALVIAAWGACKHAEIDHVKHILTNTLVHCLDVTADGSPKHPLYVSGNTIPSIYIPKVT